MPVVYKAANGKWGRKASQGRECMRPRQEKMKSRPREEKELDSGGESHVPKDLERLRLQGRKEEDSSHGSPPCWLEIQLTPKTGWALKEDSELGLLFGVNSELSSKPKSNSDSPIVRNSAQLDSEFQPNVGFRFWRGFESELNFWVKIQSGLACLITRAEQAS